MGKLVEIVASMPNSAFISLIIVAFLLAAIGLALGIFANHKIMTLSTESIEDALEAEKSKPKAASTLKSTPSVLKGKITPLTTPKPPVKRIVQVSLDSIFARNNSKLLCKYCETINSPEAVNCCACGKHLNK